MGCYNFFEGACPTCRNVFTIQTKVTGEEFEVHKLGDNVMPGSSLKLQLKERCGECGANVVAIIKDGVLESYAKDGAQVKEGLWGTILSLDDSKEKQFEEEVMEFLRSGKVPTKEQ